MPRPSLWRAVTFGPSKYSTSILRKAVLRPKQGGEVVYLREPLQQHRSRRDLVESRTTRGLFGHEPKKSNITAGTAAGFGERNGDGLPAVATSSPELLQIVLHRCWLLPMDHQTDVWNI